LPSLDNVEPQARSDWRLQHLYLFQLDGLIADVLEQAKTIAHHDLELF
jgi:hypothetical protein